MDLDPISESEARYADNMSGTASSYRAPSTAFGHTSASPAEVDWNSGLFTRPQPKATRIDQTPKV